MPRELRINPNDGLHHVTNHIVDEGQDLFADDDDRLLFLRLMERARRLFEVRIVSYCLMGNHFHLLVECPKGNLDGFMQHLEGCYAQDYNGRHGRRGALFYGRYHNELITTDGQLQFTVRYIDRNSLELGIDISTYPWGSYATYLDQGITSCEIVTLDATLVREFAGSMANYRAFVETDAAHDKFRRASGVRHVQVAQDLPPMESMKALCRVVAELTGSLVEELSVSRSGCTNTARLVAVYVASQSRIRTEIVRNTLGFNAKSTYSSAVIRSEREFKNSAEFRARVAAAQARWCDGLETAA